MKLMNIRYTRLYTDIQTQKKLNPDFMCTQLHTEADLSGAHNYTLIFPRQPPSNSLNTAGVDWAVPFDR